jgi:YVTN family beta-propeller protein
MQTSTRLKFFNAIAACGVALVAITALAASRIAPESLVASKIASAVASSGVVAPEQTPKDALLVLSKQGQTLAIVDPSNLQVIAKVPVGNDPHEVIASSDGKLAFVSNYGGGRYNTLAVIDLVAQKALPSIDLGPLRGPHGLTFVGGKVWFTAEAAKAIGRVDPATMKVDWILGTGQDRTHMVWVSPDEKWIVTSNVSAATISIIEQVERRNPGPPPGAGPGGPPPGAPPRPPMGPPTAEWHETVVAVGKGSEGFDVSPDGKEIWVANAGDGTISIVNAAQKKVIETLQANVGGANRLKFTLDGKRVLVASLGGAGLTVIDAATRKEVKRIAIGRGVAGTVMEPGGKRAFVACSTDDFIAVVDLEKLEVVGKIDVGKEPDGEAWATRR